jgi:ADP-dependent NAD(P)H-hydrate dehydratase / NAD(P)H-hydrate epimerase
MIPLLSRAEVRALDAAAVATLGVPSLVLMENAGAQAAAALRARFGGQLDQVLVLGGVGQNGGDAWVVARHLRVHGLSPRCVLVGDRAKVKGDARTNLSALEALGCAVTSLASEEPLAALLASASLIVDGLFGTGLDRPLAGLALAVVRAINAADKPVLALDLPSGVDADTGQELGAAVRAQLTVTFAAHKPGLYQHPGAALAGEIVCAQIGVPVASDGKAALIEAEDVAALLPARAADAHKGTHGHVLVIAGSAGKTGAAFLSAHAALRMGAGLVTLASDPETRRALEQKVIEIMTAAIDPGARMASALTLVAGKAAAVVGPGLGLDPEAQAFARALARELPVPAVLDADALTSLAGDLEGLRAACAVRVLTPHPGEASRLLGCSTAEVQAERVSTARALADKSGQIVVLKGARSVIAEPAGRLRIASAGTPALGTAGTGDVLAGVIGALLAQLPAFEAAFAGVELHARAGAIAARSDRGLLASELLPALSSALEQCRASARAPR